MVVLEAAAIGAASYGLYKGGEVGVRRGKEAHTEFKRESHRSSQRAELKQKTQLRSRRMSQLVNMRQNGGNASAPNISHASTTTGIMNFSSTQGRQISTEKSSLVDDRHKKVMKKLMSEREIENRKGKNKLRFNPFKKK
mmetsp:Transcript_59593/g.66689  ORF Transcript_59593/g.66689 Transcript_59593/m.66689 type:complete len:139 (-) Transcript_59593:533-949(-)